MGQTAIPVCSKRENSVANEEIVPFKPEEGVTIERIPQGKRIGTLLKDGEIDALLVISLHSALFYSLSEADS